MQPDVADDFNAYWNLGVEIRPQRPRGYQAVPNVNLPGYRKAIRDPILVRHMMPEASELVNS